MESARNEICKETTVQNSSQFSTVNVSILKKVVGLCHALINVDVPPPYKINER